MFWYHRPTTQCNQLTDDANCLLSNEAQKGKFLLYSRCFTTFAAMRTLCQEESVKIPKGVKITIKAKNVEVSGKHGSLKRSFKHLPIELYVGDAGREVRARMYFAKSKQLSMLRSVCSHISNLFDGVQKKFQYKLRLVYAHFPINANIVNGGKSVEIRNFLGEKIVRTVRLPKKDMLQTA